MSEEFALELEGVSYAYPEGRKALDEVSFRVQPGESLGIIGPNGAGKTTLLLCICGLNDFHGRINILGQALNHRNSNPLRKKLGLVFQDPNDQLFMPRVFDDVAFGPRNLGWTEEEIKVRTAETLALLQLQGFENRSGHHLSLGEKKRAALATALIMKPEILLFDEPTNSLDPKGRRELIEIIRQNPKTRLIASHDLEMILDLCGRVILLSQGKIAAVGEPAAILADPELMAAHGLEVPHSLLSARHQHPSRRRPL